MSNMILECRQVAKVFQRGPEQVAVLQGVDFGLAKGEFVTVIGNSGSGKTTFLQLLSGLDVPSSGDVLVEGQNFSAMRDKQRGLVRNRSIGFVYQFHHLLPEFTALENVSMPLLMRPMPLRDVKRLASEMLARVGLEHRLKHKPAELSGGERQRVAIARALVTQPACVLADEPTGNLDAGTAEDIQRLMSELNRDLATAFLIVTHDLSFTRLATRIMKMDRGVLRTVTDSQALFTQSV